MNAFNVGKTADRNLHDDISQLREDLTQLRHDVASMANDVFGVAKEGMSGAVDNAKRRGREVADSLEGQVQDHPLATIGAAFGIGLLVGAFLRRR
jgi:ElaB/YqjD/DUF883 family membrane-anchored ribosome-binding protein